MQLRGRLGAVYSQRSRRVCRFRKAAGNFITFDRKRSFPGATVRTVLANEGTGGRSKAFAKKS